MTGKSRKQQELIFLLLYEITGIRWSWATFHKPNRKTPYAYQLMGDATDLGNAFSQWLVKTNKPYKFRTKAETVYGLIQHFKQYKENQKDN